MFNSIAANLAMEWLSRYRDASVFWLYELFKLSSEKFGRNEINEIIENRCRELKDSDALGYSHEMLEERKEFWFIRHFYYSDCIDYTCWEWIKADKNNLHLFIDNSGFMGVGRKFPRLSSFKLEKILDAFFIHWPEELTSDSQNIEMSKSEQANFFWGEIVNLIRLDVPDNSISTFKNLLADQRYKRLHKSMKSALSEIVRGEALRDFEPPSGLEITGLLDRDDVATVEGLRQLVLQELTNYQKDIDGSEFNIADVFYDGNVRKAEEPCTRIIADRLKLRLESKNITITLEHHVKHDKRCDFTASKVISGKRRLLVTEVKGQWHQDLYTAAVNQLGTLYAIHPDAEHQGIFLVIWFGASEKVANRKNHGILSAVELKEKIEGKLPSDLSGRIDVFVLDVSKF